MSKRDNVYCRSCGLDFNYHDLLKDVNPFDDNQICLGCPECKEVMFCEHICDKPGCSEVAFCCCDGIWVCSAHYDLLDKSVHRPRLYMLQNNKV